MKKFWDFLDYFFIPSERNNLRAKALHHDFLTFYLVIALLLVFFFFTFRAQITHVLAFATDITVQKLHELTNQERQNNGLSTLNYNDALAAAAYLKAQDMLQQNYWAHYSPSGRSPWDFVKAAGYNYQLAGENLAKNFLFSQDVVSAWMASPTHRDNIVRGDFKDVGFSVVNGVLNGEETTLVVQMFGAGSTTQEASSPIAVAAEENPNPEPTQVVQPTNTPQPTKVQEKEKDAIVASNKKNLSKFSFNLSYIFIGFILLVLIVDLYFAKRMNILRVTGKNLAHIVFLMFIIAGFVLYITKGSIL